MVISVSYSNYRGKELSMNIFHCNVCFKQFLEQSVNVSLWYKHFYSLFLFSEARKALLSLGYGSEVTDAMAEAVCLEVRRLGNQDAITEQVLGHQHKEMVSYVLQRPVNPLSARDYLTDKTRLV